MTNQKYRLGEGRITKALLWLSPQSYQGIRRWVHRGGLWVIALAMGFSVVLPIVDLVIERQAYALTPDIVKLIGPANENLAKKIVYDPDTDAYVFNKSGMSQNVGSTNGLPSDMANIMKSQIGGANAESTNLYSVTLPTDASKGIEYYDSDTQLSFRLAPNFITQPGRLEEDRLVYPMQDGIRGVYTAKTNGLKEDIVLTKPLRADTLAYSYTLKLPSTLEARMMNDGSGDLGIYSADPALFGNISYGSDADRLKVESARETGPKNHLVFVIPAPLIKQRDGSQSTGQLTLGGDGVTLTVSVEGLRSWHYPASIDPSVVVTSSNDFASGNNGGNIDFNTDQLNRAQLTGGKLNSSWANGFTGSTSFQSRVGLQTLAYNGYMYVIGGYSGTYYNDIQYAPINGTAGQIGPAWTVNATSFSTGRYYHQAFIYNGYMYVLGGLSSGGDRNDVQYAKINVDGSVGAWHTTCSFTNARERFGIAVYGGTVYVVGGENGGTSAKYNDVQYASFKGDGEIGAWTTTTSFTTARYGLSAQAYNGYLYMIGGYDGTTYYNDIQYAPIKSDGSLGSWVATTGFTTARSRFSVVAYNGYMYVLGGITAGGNANDVQYAPIYANGSVGPWTGTTSFTTARYGMGAVAYNGYLYLMGGYDGTTYYNDIQSVQVAAAGTMDAFNTGPTFTVARDQAGAAAYNGYIYLVGGYSGSSALASVRYAQINSDGSLASWVANTTTAPNLPVSLQGVSVQAYNGYLYAFGGGASTNNVYSIAINSDGTLSSGGWVSLSSTSALPQAIQGGNTAIYNGYVYIVGGINPNASTYLNTVYYAAFGTGGTLGAWTTATNTFTAARQGAGVIATAGYLYVIGGETATSTSTNNVQYSAIGSAGAPGTWNNTTSLPMAIGLTMAATANGYIYIGGGDNNGTITNQDFSVMIKNDGTLSSWQSGSTIPARQSLNNIIANGYMYTFAGYNGTGRTNTSYYMPLDNGGMGTVGSWQAATSLNTARAYAATSVYNGYIYVAGGDTGGGVYTNTVEYAKINADGSLGSWTTSANAFSTARYGLGAVAYMGYLIIAGGRHTTLDQACDNTGANNRNCNDVQYASLDPSTGAVGTWQTATGAYFNTPKYGFASLLYSNVMYLVGGTTSSNYYSSAQSCTLGTDTTGALTFTNCWITRGNNFTTAREGAVAFAANGYLYVAGGNDSAGNPLGDVQYSPITLASGPSNGNLGVWQVTTSMNMGRTYATAAILNGYVYVVGGKTTTGVTSVGYAPILTGGGVGNWQLTTSLPVEHYGSASAIANGYYYNVGGLHNTTDTACNSASSQYCSDTKYASLASIARVGHYSKAIDTNATGVIRGIQFTGTLPNLGGDPAMQILYRTSGPQGAYSATSSTAYSLGTGQYFNAFCNTGGGNSTDEYVWVFITLDDSLTSATFPDSSNTANTAYLADLTVNYQVGGHPVPQNRLRQGKFFSGETLQAMDTCGP